MGGKSSKPRAETEDPKACWATQVTVAKPKESLEPEPESQVIEEARNAGDDPQKDGRLKLTGLLTTDQMHRSSSSRSQAGTRSDTSDQYAARRGGGAGDDHQARHSPDRHSLGVEGNNSMARTSSHSSADPDRGSFHPGQSVYIHSLLHATDLNGQEGILRFYDAHARRWVIRLTNGIEKGIRAANMSLVEAAQLHTATGSATLGSTMGIRKTAGSHNDDGKASDKSGQELEAVLLQTNWSTIYQIFHQRYQVAKMDQIGGSFIVKSAVEMTLSIASKCYALLRSDPSGRLHCTPLHIAALQSSTEACEVIIRDRPQLVVQTHKPSASTLCPLHIAILSGALGVVELLLEGQANPNVRTLHDVCPLHLAAASSKELCELLLSFNADPFKRDVMGSTCLHYAATFKKTLVIDYLLVTWPLAKRLVCEPDQKRVTPLHIGCALYSGEEDYHGLMSLLANGAKPLATDVSGTAARDLVPWYRHSNVQKFFETCGDRLQEAAQEWLDQWRRHNEQEEQPDGDADRAELSDNTERGSLAGSEKAVAPRSQKHGRTGRPSQQMDAEELAKLREASEEASKLKHEVERLTIELTQSQKKCEMLEQAGALQKQSLEDMQKLCDSAHSQRQWQLEEVQRQQLEERQDWEGRLNRSVEAAKVEAQKEWAQKVTEAVNAQRAQAEQELEALRAELEQQHQEQLKVAKEEAASADAKSPTLERKASVLQRSLNRTASMGHDAQLTELHEEVSKLQALYQVEQARHLHCRNQLQDMKGAVRVFCRLLPSKEENADQLSQEAEEVDVVRRLDAFTVEISEPKAREFEFDGVFEGASSMDDIFTECRDAVRSAVDGMPATILALGQSSNPKLRTLYGDKESGGMARLVFEEIFKATTEKDREEYTVQLTFLELHQGKLTDLFGDAKKEGPEVEVETTENGELVIRGAGCEVASSAREAEKLVAQALKKKRGSKDRATSHLILSVAIEGKQRGRLMLCDLAGAEWLGQAPPDDGDRSDDVAAVTESFSALTAVVEALVKGSKQVPYRNHLLTSLLEENLSSRGKTLMLVTCSPHRDNAEESLACLAWGKRAREIRTESSRSGKSSPRKTQAANQEVQRLQKETQRLEAEVASRVEEIKGLQEQVQKLQEEAAATRARRAEAEDRCQRLVLERQEAESREKAAAITLDNRMRDLEMQQQQALAQAASDVELMRKRAEAAEASRAEAQPTIDRLTSQVHDLEAQFAEEQQLRKKYHNQIQDMKGAIRVICRFRPLVKREMDAGDHVIARRVDAFNVEVNKAGGEGVSGHRDDKVQNYMFDSTFDGGSTQEEVFADCKDLVQSTVDGYNVTIFAYGQTGAGKTFTMYGSKEEPGLAPRSIEALFSVIRKEERKAQGNKVFTVKAYMIEVYKQDIIDLLTDHPKAKDPGKVTKGLEVKRDVGRGMMYVEGVTERKVSSPEELNAILVEGEKRRHTASTKMNSASSRSHLLLSIIVECSVKDPEQVIYGKITLCDLAGSERPKKSEVVGDNLKEAIEINKSLSALGDVIEALTKGAKQVPYRNHKLTMLMQDSLGGTAKTLMFVNCSPAQSNAEETLMSLKWASRARQVTNDVKRNADTKEVARLKEVIKMMSAAQHAVDQEPVGGGGGAEDTLSTGHALVS